MSKPFLTRTLSVAYVCLAVATVAAQDPLTVSPDAYRLEFENAWVKVVRVVYGPKAAIAAHFHTEQASAYVYLKDGGPILFKHEGLPYASVTRPATKAGSFRVYKGIKEVHSVENPTETPSEFLRVEFKTEPLEEASLKGKFFREEPAPTRTVQRPQFENAQIRITRVVVTPGDALTVTAAAGNPMLVVALATTELEHPGAQGTRRLETGQAGWIDAAASATIRGVATTSTEVLRFDFKSAPAPQR